MVMWRERQKTADHPHYVMDAPGGKKGTEEDQGQIMEGTTWIVS